MCGIAGMISLDGSVIDPRDVRMMCDLIEHRGPDDEGFFDSPDAVLGMRRLSIIDLDGGHQPLSNEDGSVWVVFNGEIYNYRDIRKDLLNRGHALATATDTEVIVHLYEEYGDALVDHLRGMFGFALWDTRRKRLLLGRDRFGIKPLYYTEADGKLIFASELKSILALGSVERRLDWAAVNHVFTSLTTPASRSIIDGVAKLEPAHVLNAGPGHVTAARRYWSLQFEPNETATEAELVETLRAQLDESIRLHMVSDVPVGAFLSGGIDSSAVVARMSRLTNRRVQTFSIGFREEAFNELPHARVVAKAFDTDHHELVLEPDVISVLDDLVWHLDEPFGDSSAIPTYMVSRLASEHVKVVLSGDGGDELFAGYSRYGIEERERRIARWAAPLRGVMRLAAGAMPETMRGRNLLQHYGLAGWDRYLDSMTVYRPDSLARLFQRGAYEQMAKHDPWREQRHRLGELRTNAVTGMQHLDVHAYLPLDILTKVDRMSMAHSLEARVPLLDHKLAEFAATIPPRLLLDRNGSGKQLLKRALRGCLPDGIIDRKKSGFGVPLSQWFRGRMEPFLRDTLLSDRARQRGILNPSYVEELIRRQHDGRVTDLQLWTMLSFELWCRTFLDERARGLRPGGRSRDLTAPALRRTAEATHQR